MSTDGGFLVDNSYEPAVVFAAICGSAQREILPDIGIIELHGNPKGTPHRASRLPEEEHDGDAEREQEHQRQRDGSRYASADLGENPDVDAEPERGH